MISREIQKVPEGGNALNVFLRKTLRDHYQDILDMSMGEADTTEDIITKSPWVDVRAYGAVDGATDNVTEITNAIIAATAAGRGVFFPGGTWNFSTGLTITCPIIALGYRNSILNYTGSSGFALTLTNQQHLTLSQFQLTFTSGTACGIAVNQSGTGLSGYNILENLLLQGPGQAVGSTIGTSFGAPATGYTNYFNHVNDVTVTHVETGVKYLSGTDNAANGNFIRDLTLYGVGIGVHNYATENLINGIFHTNSANATIVKIEGTADFTAQYNTVILHGEQGGANAVSYDINQYATHNLIIDNSVTTLGGTDSGNNNQIISRRGGNLTVYDGRYTFTDGDTTPSVAQGSWFVTANTNPTTYSDFDDAVEAKIIIVCANDFNTTIGHDSTKISLWGKGNHRLIQHDCIIFASINGVWVEQGRFNSQENAITNRTANFSLSAYHTGSIQTNSGAGGAVVATLPAVVAGMEFTFWVLAAQNFDINPNNADQILGLTNAAGDAIRSATIGDTITLRGAGTSGSYWMVKSINGTWADVD